MACSSTWPDSSRGSTPGDRRRSAAPTAASAGSPSCRRAWRTPGATTWAGCIDITEAKRAHDDLEFMANHDPLTRLANRRALVRRMQDVLAHPTRGGQQVGLLFLDLDGLKNVNDRFGHTAGDDVIVDVADRFRASVRGDDVVAGLGGDELVVLLPSVRALNDAVAVGDKLRAALGTSVRLEGAVIDITASAGVTLAAPGEEPDTIIDRADRALYRAKETGRNQTVAYDAALDTD